MQESRFVYIVLLGLNSVVKYIVTLFIATLLVKQQFWVFVFIFEKSFKTTELQTIDSILKNYLALYFKICVL